jgi:hypothetical protein
MVCLHLPQNQFQSLFRLCPVDKRLDGVQCVLVKHEVKGLRFEGEGQSVSERPVTVHFIARVSDRGMDSMHMSDTFTFVMSQKAASESEFRMCEMSHPKLTMRVDSVGINVRSVATKFSSYEPVNQSELLPALYFWSSDSHHSDAH